MDKLFKSALAKTLIRMPPLDEGEVYAVVKDMVILYTSHLKEEVAVRALANKGCSWVVLHKRKEIIQ